MVNPKSLIRKLFRKIVGYNDNTKQIATLQEEVKTLQFFLNELHDITDVPATKDSDLRIMQQCDAIFLGIIDKLCKKHNLHYWIDFGTLLGARRHKGFIPWDDDTDIAMPREDYNIITEIINTELGKYGIAAEESIGRIGVGYKHSKTGIWTDIFAVDTYYTDKIDQNEKDNLIEKINTYRKILKNGNERTTPNWEQEKRNEIIGGIEPKSHILLYHAPEFDYPYNTLIHNYTEVVPLQRFPFDGVELNIPSKMDDYLRGIYGDSFMSFPLSGILHHDLGRGALSIWAKRSGTDMNTILNELIDIKNKI